MSDIHGRYEKFNKMLEKIHFSDNDTLYILGDIIDRGEDGIKILADVMEKENVILLMGNHEYMMLNTFLFNKDFPLWVRNGGFTTFENFLTLSNMEQNDILDYLYHLPLIIPSLNVNGKLFYLVHAFPILNLSSPLPKYLYHLNEKEIKKVLWSRSITEDEISFISKQYPHHTFVFGHTITSHIKPESVNSSGQAEILKINENFIDIDCGCAIQDENIARLGCLRLDDMQKFYV